MNNKKSIILSIITGVPIGCLGGLIGLGGAEFRLPFLVGLFKKTAYQSIALNLAVSLLTIISSIIFRLPKFESDLIIPSLFIIIFLLSGSITGAYFGAHFAKKVNESILNKIILILLISIGLLLIVEGITPFVSTEAKNYPILINFLLGLSLGFIIGLISSMLGVAGGELIIPVLIIVFGIDIKIAGTMSLLISFPTIIIGIIRHCKNGGYSDTNDLKFIVAPMGIASIFGALIGTLLLAFVSNQILKIMLGFILIISAVKIFLKKES